MATHHCAQDKQKENQQELIDDINHNMYVWRSRWQCEQQADSAREPG